MKELKKAPESMLKFSGTPTEIGGQIWERMCLPAVGKIGRELPPVALGQLYVGLDGGRLRPCAGAEFRAPDADRF